MNEGRILELANELFNGDQTAATRWLTSPKKALGNKRPIDCAKSEEGAREVANLIGRIGHGVFS